MVLSDTENLEEDEEPKEAEAEAETGSQLDVPTVEVWIMLLSIPPIPAQAVDEGFRGDLGWKEGD